jgi:hypothetical protein
METLQVLTALEGVWRNIGLREIVHWIVAGFEEQEDVFAIGDPSSARPYAHAPAQRLGV